MDKQQKHNLSLGLGGVFRGLSDLLQIAVEIAESEDAGRTAATVRRERTSGLPGLHAVYGVSVRVGARGAPVVTRFGNVRQNADREPVIEEEREPLVDVLDEDDHYLIVAELPGVGQDAVSWRLRDTHTLVIGGDAPERKYSRTVALADPVNDQTAMSSYANGILQLKLWKVAPR